MRDSGALTLVRMKTCSKCGEAKVDGAYSKGRNTCKACRSASAKLWRATQPDSYVRALLSKGTSVRPAAWPPDLVEAKRGHLQIRSGLLALDSALKQQTKAK
jgi:hypothetical protein